MADKKEKEASRRLKALSKGDATAEVYVNSLESAPVEYRRDLEEKANQFLTIYDDITRLMEKVAGDESASGFLFLELQARSMRDV